MVANYGLPFQEIYDLCQEDIMNYVSGSYLEETDY